MSEILALQGAIVQRLASDIKLLKLVPIDLMAEEEKHMRLYSYIPLEAISPYIHVDNPEVVQEHYRPELIQDVSITLHMWHDQSKDGQYGNTVIGNILYAVKQALRFKLFPIGYEVLEVRITSQRIFEDVNADVKHAVLTLIYKLEKL